MWKHPGSKNRQFSFFPTPRRTPLGVSLKRTGICMFLGGYLIFSKTNWEKKTIYIFRNWVFDFLTTAFIKTKNLPRGVLQFLITVQHLELRNLVVCMWQLPDIMALVPFISFCFLVCLACLFADYVWQLDSFFFCYDRCWSLDVCFLHCDTNMADVWLVFWAWLLREVTLCERMAKHYGKQLSLMHFLWCSRICWFCYKTV
jgi:hypothetical protein